MTNENDCAAASALQNVKADTSSAPLISGVTLSRRGQFLCGGAALAMLAWAVTATAFLAIDLIDAQNDSSSGELVREAYETRIDDLLEERRALKGEIAGLEGRFDLAISTMKKQKQQILDTKREQAELVARLDAARGTLNEAITDRNRAETYAADLTETMAALHSKVNEMAEAEELSGALNTVSGALESVARDRDAAHSDVERLETEIASLELSMEIASERQEQLVSGLEDAVEMTFKPLETMFERSGLDVDSLVSTIRPSYSGFGGATGPITMGARSFDDPELTTRFDELMDGMDRMNLMRIAASKIPYSMPVTASHRFTSGFGTRRDPKTGGRRAHNGIDLAAPRGTPILSAAEGVVVFAGRQSGYGNLIKIRHEFGFETLYAHLNKIHVRTGDRIARGDHIGDMGTTGRSTGVHLHYEVRIGGKPVNPMTFIKAAKDVF